MTESHIENAQSAVLNHYSSVNPNRYRCGPMMLLARTYVQCPAHRLGLVPMVALLESER